MKKILVWIYATVFFAKLCDCSAEPPELIDSSPEKANQHLGIGLFNYLVSVRSKLGYFFRTHLVGNLSLPYDLFLGPVYRQISKRLVPTTFDENTIFLNVSDEIFLRLGGKPAFVGRPDLIAPLLKDMWKPIKSQLYEFKVHDDIVKRAKVLYLLILDFYLDFFDFIDFMNDQLEERQLVGDPILLLFSLKNKIADLAQENLFIPILQIEATCKTTSGIDSRAYFLFWVLFSQTCPKYEGLLDLFSSERGVMGDIYFAELRSEFNSFIILLPVSPLRVKLFRVYFEMSKLKTLIEGVPL